MHWGRQLPLVGRATELAFALDLVDRVAAATGQALVIEGEAGIGKTHFLDEVLRATEASGFHVVRGAGGQLEADVGFTPLVEALGLRVDAGDDRRAAIGRLLAPEAAQHGPASDGSHHRQQVVQGIVDLVEALCEQTPLVLAIDDAHWVDDASLAVVDRLARRLGQLPLLLVVSARPYPRSAGLSGVLDRLLTTGAAHLTLGGLPDEAVAELAAAALRAEPGPALRSQLAAVAGNPLFATELLAALEQEDAVAVHAGHAEVGAARLPPSLRLTILRRLSVLPNDTVELLRMAAVLGTTFDPAALATIVQRPALAIARGLEPAHRAGVIADRDGRLGFRHDLVRDAVYDDLPQALRESLHADAAQLLAAAGHPPERTAPHLLRGSLTPDEETIEQLRRTAGEIGARAPDVAVDLLRRILELATDDDPHRDEVEVELTTALAWAQRPNEAAALADRLLADLAPGPARRSVLTMRAVVAQFLGDFKRFPQALEAAAVEPDATERERARLLAAATVSWIFANDPARARAVGADALAAAEEAADDFALCATLVALAVAADAAVELPEALALARRAVEVGRRSRDAELHRLIAPELTLATIASKTPGHQDEAIELLRGALTRAEDRALPEFAATFQLTLGAALYRAGQWDEALVELEAGIDRALELGRAPGTTVEACCWLIRMAVHRDDLVTARAWLDRAEAAASPETPTAHTVRLAVAAAEVSEAAGELEAAAEQLVKAYAATPPAVRPPLAPVLAVPLVRLATATDQHREDAREVVATIAEDDSTAYTATWLGGVLDGDLEAGEVALRRACRRGTVLCEELPLLREDVATLRAEAGRTDGATALLEEASDSWEQLGAVRGVARVEARLRDLGVRRGTRGPRRRPDTGWEALTEAEQRVVDLVAEGLIYREVAERLFISRRTVETHVAHVFTKLGVANRRELEIAHAQHRAELRPGRGDRYLPPGAAGLGG